MQEGRQTVAKQNFPSINFAVLSGMFLNTSFSFARHSQETGRTTVLLRGTNAFWPYLPDASNGDEINELLAHAADLLSGSNSLIILDDCAVSKDLKSRSNKFIDLAFSGRHQGLSVWVLTQQLTSIAKPFRDNVAAVIAFHNPSQIGTKGIFEDYGGDLNAETRKRLTHLLKTERYSRLCFCLRFPFQCYLEIPASSI